MTDNTFDHQDATIAIDVLAAEASTQSIIANLLELYLHDFSDFANMDIGEDGRFGYPYLNTYWQENNRYPFLIRANTKLAGFALVRQGTHDPDDPESMNLAEFFVLRRWLRCGVGQAAAHLIFHRFPGAWKVRVIKTNVGALTFWEKVIASYTKDRFERSEYRKHDELWVVFHFQG
ncbi:GNAT family N-acetyltransferase [Candidatus Entotheonella serta]|nr:GNAT family N-acetyltransferase [Candidatus Entotheonella serta]